MAREFDPITREPIANEPLRNDTLRNAPVESGRSGLGMIGLLVGLAVAIALGLTFWSMSDRTDTTTLNTAPGATTGSATTSPPSPASPPSAGTTTPPASR